jgi:tetratricopeptide (TPR) repeat protein
MRRSLFCSLAVLVLGAGVMVACQARSSAAPHLGSGPLDNAEAYLRRGDEYAAAQDYPRAIADYSEALRLRPDWPEAYNNRGYSYWWHGQGDEALADYNRALALRPQYAYAYNNRGVVYMAGGQPVLAVADFTHAIELQPDFPQAYRNRANVELRLGQLGLALADFRRAGVDPMPLLLVVCGVSLALALAGAFGAIRWLRGRVPRSV